MDISSFLFEAGSAAVIFITVWIVVGKVMFKPYFNMLIEREERTIGDEKRVLRHKEETTSVFNQIAQEVRAARVKGVEIRNRKIAQAKEEAQMIINTAANDLNEELDKSKNLIAQLKFKALEDLPIESEKLAALVVENVTNSTQSDTIH